MRNGRLWSFSSSLTTGRVPREGERADWDGCMTLGFMTHGAGGNAPPERSSDVHCHAKPTGMIHGLWDNCFDGRVMITPNGKEITPHVIHLIQFCLFTHCEDDWIRWWMLLGLPTRRTAVPRVCRAPRMKSTQTRPWSVPQSKAATMACKNLILLFRRKPNSENKQQQWAEWAHKPYGEARRQYAERGNKVCAERPEANWADLKSSLMFV